MRLELVLFCIIIVVMIYSYFEKEKEHAIFDKIFASSETSSEEEEVVKLPIIINENDSLPKDDSIYFYGDADCILSGSCQKTAVKYFPKGSKNIKCTVVDFGMDPAPNKQKKCIRVEQQVSSYDQGEAVPALPDDVLWSYSTSLFNTNPITKMVPANSPFTCEDSFFGAESTKSLFKQNKCTANYAFTNQDAIQIQSENK